MKNQKKAVALPFNWIFAIIAGSVILFLAIYGTTKIIGTGQKAVYTETSAKILSLLDPLETGLASGNSEVINFKKQSRIYLGCNSLSNKPFGKQTISFSEQTFGEEFGEKGGGINIKNKYVFAEDIVEGKKFYVFSKAFFMGFKVSDLIVINSNNYCFYQAPNEIKDDIEGLNLKNINFSEDIRDCEGVKVCFGSSNNCDIMVFGDGISYDSGKVIKGDEEVYYTGDLIYPAIFSSSKIYECNIQRLMNKFNELSLVYLDKIKIIQSKGCDSNIEANLMLMMDSAKSLKSSKDLIELSYQAEIVESINSNAGANNCGLW